MRAAPSLVLLLALLVETLWGGAFRTFAGLPFGPDATPAVACCRNCTCHDRSCCRPAPAPPAPTEVPLPLPTSSHQEELQLGLASLAASPALPFDSSAPSAPSADGLRMSASVPTYLRFRVLLL